MFVHMPGGGTPRPVVLDASERPLALTLQQHNYLRTHLVGETVETGSDGRFDRVNLASFEPPH